MLDGQTLVARAVETLNELCDEVVVIGRAEVALPPLGVAVFTDAPGPACVLNAMVTGLAALVDDEVLVLACDLPAAAPLLGRLMGVPLSGDAMVPTDPAGRPQPLAARYRRRETLAVGTALLAADDRRVLALLGHLDVALIPASAVELRNLNTPADL